MATRESPAAVAVMEPPAAPGGRPAVEVAHLRKSYGTLVAVDDVSFTVAEGEIFGILGPNGAGKTTPRRRRDRATAAGRRHDQAARPRPACRPAAGPRVCRCATPVGRAAGQAAGGRDPRGVSLVLPRSGRRGRAARRSRPSRQARRLLPVAVRRAAAA